MMRSDYPGGNRKKWVSDQDFVDNFDNFLPQQKKQEKRSIL